jgi:predicted dehydrogenase
MCKIKLLLIGLSNNHTEHIDAFKKNQDIEIVGLCDINPNISKLLGQEFESLPYFPDYNVAIDILKPQAIFVCLPHSEHIKILNLAIKNDIHVFKEKPFAKNLKEAIKILLLLKKSKSRIMTVSQRRFHSTYLQAKKLLNDLGHIKYVFASYCFSKETSGWRKSKKISGGGVIIDSGYHLIDLIMYYFGLPKTVRCKQSKLSKDPDCETEDFAQIELDYGNKMIQLVLNRSSKNKNEEISVYGEKGKLDISKKRIYKREYSTGLEHVFSENSGDFSDAYLNQHYSFFTSVMNEKKLYPGIKEGLLNTLVIEACYLSASSNSSLISTNELIHSKGLSL